MTEEQYLARRAELEAEAEAKKQAANRARNEYDKACEALRELLLEWREQQKGKAAQ